MVSIFPNTDTFYAVRAALLEMLLDAMIVATIEGLPPTF